MSLPGLTVKARQGDEMKANSDMSKTIKEIAQAKLIQGMADALFSYTSGTYGEPTQEVIDSMKKQAASIARKWGYSSWPGIFKAEVKL